jgi:hypothetical protein
MQVKCIVVKILKILKYYLLKLEYVKCSFLYIKFLDLARSVELFFGLIVYFCRLSICVCFFAYVSELRDKTNV